MKMIDYGPDPVRPAEEFLIDRSGRFRLIPEFFGTPWSGKPVLQGIACGPRGAALGGPADSARIAIESTSRIGYSERRHA